MIRILAPLLFMSSLAFSAEKLAVCDIDSNGETHQITVQKQTESPRNGEHYLSTLFEKGRLVYEIDERYDSSGKVDIGLGIGRKHSDGSASYDYWVFGNLPLTLHDGPNRVSVYCE